MTTVFATAAWLTAATATSASAGTIPWTDQTVFALSPTYSYVAEWMGLSAGWTVIGGAADEIYAGSAGVFAIEPSTGDIAEYNGTPGSWTVIGGPGSEFAEGGGHLYGLATDDSYVAEWNGPSGGWTIIGGPASSITAGTDGLIAGGIGGDNGDEWYYDGTPGNWTDIGDPAGALAVGENAVFEVNENKNTVSEWTGGTAWTPILTQSADDISGIVGGDQGLYVDIDNSTGSEQQYFEYDGTPGDWSLIGNGSSGLLPITESRTNLYGVTFGSNDEVASIDLYSGGTSWTVIGGPASPAIAAGD